MATKKKAASRTSRPRKVTGKKVQRKRGRRTKGVATDPSLAASNGEAKPAKKPAIKKSRGKADLDPNQPNLPIIEEDARIPAIERAMKDYVEAESRHKKGSEDMKIAVEKLPGLFKKNKISDYSCLGRMAVITPGADQVRFKKASTK